MCNVTVMLLVTRTPTILVTARTFGNFGDIGNDDTYYDMRLAHPRPLKSKNGYEEPC